MCGHMLVVSRLGSLFLALRVFSGIQAWSPGDKKCALLQLKRVKRTKPEENQLQENERIRSLDE